MHNKLLHIALILSLFLVIGCSNKYEPIVLEPINLAAHGVSKEYVFKNKYAGRYDIGLYVDKPVPYREKYESNFELEITLLQDSNALISKKLSKPEFIFYGWEKGKGGIALLVYEVPNDLPLSKTLMCRVTVLKSDLHFEEKYGKPKFFVRKMSDK